MKLLFLSRHRFILFGQVIFLCCLLLSHSSAGAAPTTVSWVDDLTGETAAIKTYTRPNIENALFQKGLLDTICTEGGITKSNIATIYGVFGMAGEYTYQYFMVVKMSDGTPYYFDADVLKESLDPVTYDMPSVVTARKSLHVQDPSLAGSGIGSAVTNTNRPVGAKQHHKFGLNSPPQILPGDLLEEEVIDWWAEKYPRSYLKVDLLGAMDIADLYNAGTPVATLEAMFDVPQATLLNMILDVNTITGAYPDIFDPFFKHNNIIANKFTPFDAYTIWFLSYNFARPNVELAKLYNVKVETIITIVDYITAKYVPVDQIEQRLRQEWLDYFNAIKAIPIFEPFNKYYEKILREIHIPYLKGASVRPVRLVDMNSFLGYSEDWTIRFKRSNPELAKELNDLEGANVLKVRACQQRLSPLRYGGYYANIKMGYSTPVSKKTISLSPYDTDEAWGVLAYKGTDGKTLIERASGFTHNDIKEIHIDKWLYEIDETTVYEVSVKQSFTTRAKFLLYIQKKEKPSLQPIYDNLVKLQPQSVYNLYGLGIDSFTGRTAFATDRVFYSTRAELKDKNFSDDELNQIELRLLKSVWAATKDAGGLGWVVTDPNALGFIETAPGLYKAKLVNPAKIIKGYTFDQMVAYYTNASGSWAARGFVSGSFIVAGGAPFEEDYVDPASGNTVHIDWNNDAIYSATREIIKKGLIDNGMLLSWIGETALPANSVMRIEKLGGGSYKYTYKVYFDDRGPFVFGYVYNPGIPESVQDQFDIYITPAWNYWKTKIPEKKIPVPKAGIVKRITDPNDGIIKEVFARGYIDGFTRAEFKYFLKEKGGILDQDYIKGSIYRREASSLWMIWKGTGGRVFNDLNDPNVIFEQDALGVFTPKYFDFDISVAGVKTFRDLFSHLRAQLTPTYNISLLVGFYDAMKLDGMTDAQILSELDTVADISPQAVADVKMIIKEGRPVSWIDTDSENANVAYKATTRRAIQKSLIEGEYGLIPGIFHKLFEGREERIVIKSITGEYLYSDPVRDHYKITFNISEAYEEGSASVLIAVSNAGSAALRAQFDGNKKALFDVDSELGLERFAQKDFELTDQNGSHISKNVVAEEYLPGSITSPEILKTPLKGPERAAVLEAMAYLYSTLYQTIKDPASGLYHAVLADPYNILLNKIADDDYGALPVDYINISSSFSLIDYYFSKIPEFVTVSDVPLKIFKDILGRDFLVAAAATSAYAAQINTYLATLPEPALIDEILRDLGYPTNGKGYATFRDARWQKLYGKSITINGVTYAMPSNLNTVVDYAQMYNVIDSALGDEVKVGDVRAYSDADVAAVMREVLAENQPSALDMDILKVIGVNTVDDLKAVLNSYPAFSKEINGRILTPRLALSLLRAASFTTHIYTPFVEKIDVKLTSSGRFGKWMAQPLEKIFLTESEYTLIASICKNSGLIRYVDGMYIASLHTVIFKDVDAYLHELTHAQQRARLDVWARAQNPPLSSELFGTYRDLLRMVEGSAQDGLIKKLGILDRLFGEQLGAAYTVWKGLGFFGVAAKAANFYYTDSSLALTNWMELNKYLNTPSHYLKETDEYRQALIQYGSGDFIDRYLQKYISRPGGISVDDFLKNFGTPRYVIKTGISKLLAISDIHGGYDGLVSTLINAGVIRKGGTLGQPNVFEIPTRRPAEPLLRYTYTGGDTLLVFLGDYINKGEESDLVIRLIQALELKTQVIALMGNHEANLLQDAYIEENTPVNFGLESKLNVLKQFGYNDYHSEVARQFLYKTDSPKAALSDLLEKGPIDSLQRINFMPTQFLYWIQERPVIAKVTLNNGKSFLFMHGGFTESAWKVIDGYGEWDIWDKFNTNIYKNVDLFYSVTDAKAEEWINNEVLINNIMTKLKVDSIIAGHYKHMGGKSPSEISLVGAEVNGAKKIWALDTAMSPGEAVGGYPVQGAALIIDSMAGIKVVKGDVLPSPVIANPVKFTLLKNGMIDIDGGKKVILRKVFKEWYCDGKDLYKFANDIGYLDLTEKIETVYNIKGNKIALALPSILFADELGNYPFYFIYQPNAVDMYYQAIPLGKTTFTVANNNQDLFIDTLSLQTNQISNTPITATEAARALILKAYKLNSKALNKIAAKTWLGTETWNAFQSLVTDGYLTYLGESGGYKNYQVQASMLSASFTISEKGVPGNMVVTGTKDAPNLNHAATPVITNGILPKNTKFEIGEDNIVKIETGSDVYVISQKTLLDLAQASFGVREFNIKLEGTATFVKLRDGVVMADGVTYQAEGASAFWVEQVNYVEGGIEKFRWETGYRPGNPLAIPNEFKSSYMSNLDMIVISRGRTPFTRALYNMGVTPTDLEVTFVRVGTSGARGKIFVPYKDFVEKILPGLPEASVYGNGYNVNLLNGNKIWFSSDVKDPAVWGEGPMFKNLGGYSVDGLPYKNYIKMLSLPSQEFILFPNFPGYSLAIYDVPIEPAAVNLGEIETANLFGGRVLKLKMNVIINVAGDGSEEIMVDYPVTKMTTEPTYFRMQLARALNYIRTPLGGAVVFGGFNTVVIVVNYLSNENYTTEMLYGDLFGNAAFMGTWYVGGKAVEYLAKQAAGNFAKLGVGSLSLVIAPISIFVQDFAGSFYTEWHRAEDVDSKLFNIRFGTPTIAYRAWLDVISSWGNFLIGHNFEGGSVKPDIEGTIANALWDKYLTTGIETGELKNLTEEGFFEAKKTFMLDNALPKAKKYGDIYREEVIDAIVEALAVNLTYPYYDRYGFHLPLPNPGYGSLPVSASRAADMIIKDIGQLYERLSTGDGGAEISIDAILGKEAFENEYSLGALFGLARREVADIKRILEDARPYYAPGPQYDTYYPIRGLGVYGIFYTLGIPRCDEILALLTNANFSANKIYTTLIPNTGFEYAGSDYVPLRSYRIEPPQTTFTLPNEVIFNGVKYYRDVKADNLISGESPASERWGFIGQ